MFLRKKFFVISVFITALSLLLCSCSSKGYCDDASCSELSSAAKDALGMEQEYAGHGEEYLEYFFEDDTYHDDFSIIYTVDANNIDEIGIFHAPDAHSADELYEDAVDYIEDMRKENRAFIGSYAPEELPKLDGAKVRIFGNYVVYVIAEPDQIDSALDAIEKVLKA
ncbi:MAG: DUF4358 domain-containing protein [Clostridia bacterium]|nr:DUF4358 domain-containing protein [Clostridia bacterium]